MRPQESLFQVRGLRQSKRFSRTKCLIDEGQIYQSKIRLLLTIWIFVDLSVLEMTTRVSGRSGRRRYRARPPLKLLGILPRVGESLSWILGYWPVSESKEVTQTRLVLG